MLTAKELSVLKAVMAQCGDRESALFSQEKLLSQLKIKKFTEQDLEVTVNSLQVEGYFEVIRCYKGKEKMLCIFPKLKGKCYQRERKQLYGNLAIKVIFAVLGSVTAFIVTKLLYGLF
ncbi:MAG: hypothetical protein IKA61_05590 [Clostridia bacterium]|nr:hypothetical protein [Clostridia bacterium]